MPEDSEDLAFLNHVISRDQNMHQMLFNFRRYLVPEAKYKR